MAQFAGNAYWAELPPLFPHSARPTPLKGENEYVVLALREETAVQAAVGSIVWALRHLGSKSQSVGRYALHSVRPNFPFSLNSNAVKFMTSLQREAMLCVHFVVETRKVRFQSPEKITPPLYSTRPALSSGFRCVVVVVHSKLNEARIDFSRMRDCAFRLCSYSK